MEHLRVLIELNSSDLRMGAVNDALDLAELAAPGGARFALCGPLTPAFREEAARRGIATLTARSRMFSRRELPWYAVSVVCWIVRLLWRRPDVVHLNYAGYGPSLACAAYLCRIPVVARAGGPFVSSNLANRWTAAYVANCRAHAEALLGSPLADRVVVTGDLFRAGRMQATRLAQRPLPPRRAGVVRVVFLGQLVERKGLHVLIAAFAQVKGAAELLMVGGQWEGSGYPTEIQALARQAGVASRVHYENHREDVGAILQDADVFVLPSLGDARPRSIIEAMSLGLPVVASHVGGIPSLVVHEETGLLVPPGDVDRLADALESMVGSPMLRRRFGEAGRRRAQAECQPDRTAAEYVGLYRRLALGDRASADSPIAAPVGS
jgi:glycosyltransferase involved in cell wall biosynthesis